MPVSGKVEPMVFDDFARAFSTAVAEELAEQRKARRISYPVLAEETGIPKRTLIRMLQGASSIDLAELSRIAFALGTDPGVVIRNAQARVKDQ